MAKKSRIRLDFGLLRVIGQRLADVYAVIHDDAELVVDPASEEGEDVTLAEFTAYVKKAFDETELIEEIAKHLYVRNGKERISAILQKAANLPQKKGSNTPKSPSK